MRSPSKPHILALLLGIAGLALFIQLLHKHGLRDVLEAFAQIRWGLAAVLAFHLVPLLLDAFSWRSLFPPGQRLSIWQLFWMRWIGEAGNALLPSAQVGGDVLRARLAATHGGAPVAVAAATILGDITLSVVTQFIFTITGLVLLAAVTGHAPAAGPVVVGSMLAVAAIAGFYLVQRLGMFRFLARLVSRLAGSTSWQSLVQSGENLDREILALYARTRGVIACTFWNMLSWVCGAGEVWIALHALGIPGGFAKAFILETVGQGVRAVLFVVPGGVGIQEGGYVVVGALLGIPGDTALALSLVRRVREIVFGLPALLTWQFLEARRLFRRPSASPDPAK